MDQNDEIKKNFEMNKRTKQFYFNNKDIARKH